MATVTRIIQYTGTVEQLQHQLSKSMPDGIHDKGRVVINICTVESDLPPVIVENEQARLKAAFEQRQRDGVFVEYKLAIESHAGQMLGYLMEDAEHGPSITLLCHEATRYPTIAAAEEAFANYPGGTGACKPQVLLVPKD